MKILCSIMLLFASVLMYAQEENKYEIKSATITKEMLTNGISSTCTIYFDDFGKKEALEMIFPILKKPVWVIMEGKSVVTIDKDTQTATRMTLPEPPINYNHLTAEIKQKYRIKELGEEDVNGKSCKKFAVEIAQNGQIIQTISWIWKGIPLQSETSSNGQVIVTEKTTQIKEGKVDVTKFIIPENIKITAM